MWLLEKLGDCLEHIGGLSLKRIEVEGPKLKSLEDVGPIQKVIGNGRT